MYQNIAGAITPALAEAEEGRLFSEPPKPKPAPTLPADLLAHGFTLIIRGPRRGFAVSPRYGCTGTKETLRRVVDEARDLVAFVEYVNKRKEGKTDEVVNG